MPRMFKLRLVQWWQQHKDQCTNAQADLPDDQPDSEPENDQQTRPETNKYSCETSICSLAVARSATKVHQTNNAVRGCISGDPVKEL